MKEKNMIIYHGTVWEKPLYSDQNIEESMPAFSFKNNFNELNAFFLTDHADIAQFFANEKLVDPDLQKKVILKGVIQDKKTFEINFSLKNQIVVFDKQKYDIKNPEDRIALHLKLTKEGYTSFNMKNCYQINNKDVIDIACFDVSIIEFNSVCILNNENTKKQWLDIPAARNLLLNEWDFEYDSLIHL